MTLERIKKLAGLNENIQQNLGMNEDPSMGAPDYNPAKASSGGPAFGKMPHEIKLAGDSIWDRDGENPDMVTMTDYEMVTDKEGYVEVVVEHDGPWTVYTDSGFEKHISEMIGMEVTFSEQGMQEDGRAHLEGGDAMESKTEAHKSDCGCDSCADKETKMDANDELQLLLKRVGMIKEAMESDEVMAIMAKHPEEVAKMKQMGDIDTRSELYMELYRYYSDEMPIGTQKARDGDPVEWIMDRLDDLGMVESQKVNQEPTGSNPNMEGSRMGNMHIQNLRKNAGLDLDPVNN